MVADRLLPLIMHALALPAGTPLCDVQREHPRTQAYLYGLGRACKDLGASCYCDQALLSCSFSSRSLSCNSHISSSVMVLALACFLSFASMSLIAFFASFSLKAFLTSTLFPAPS